MFNPLRTVLLAFTALAFSQVPAYASGAPLTLAVHPHAGEHSLDVTGTAPAGSVVDIVLYATVSKDLPLLRLNHLTAQAGPYGTYAITVPITPDYVKGSILTIQASTEAGATAVARTTLAGTPSEEIPSMDDLPNTPF